MVYLCVQYKQYNPTPAAAAGPAHRKLSGEETARQPFSGKMMTLQTLSAG